MKNGVVHLSLGPMGDWFCYTLCAGYAAHEWIATDVENVTCHECIALIEDFDNGFEEG